jgi:putative aldouronate transport system permease protein
MTYVKRSKNHIVKRDRLVLNGIGYILVGVFALLCVLPFYAILIASFTSESSLMVNGYSLYIRDFSTEAYELAFRNPMTILLAYRNTVGVTLVGTVCSVLLASMTGYVLQRQDFPWRNKLSFFFFFTTLFNGGLVPTYIINTQIFGFKNHFYALVLPLMFSVWNMIIAKTFMKSIPFELTESAKIDGANDLYIFFRIILPLSKPLIATIGLFSALAYWNDWYICMLYMNKEEMYNLQYFLNQIINSIAALKVIASNGGTVDMSQVSLPQETMKMAMTMIATGPIIFLYPFVQRFFVKGLTIGAVKG